MRRLILLAAVAALFLVALPVASAGAAPPEQVTFQGPSHFAGPHAFTGEFTATGPALGSGTVCETGTTEDLYTTTVQVGGNSEGNLNLRILKEFTCDDLTGTFLVKLQVRIRAGETTTFKWVVGGGTGTYANLKGHGKGYVDHDLFDGSDRIGVWDVYEGSLH